jgi:hypothetical protein
VISLPTIVPTTRFVFRIGSAASTGSPRSSAGADLEQRLPIEAVVGP